MSGSGDLFILSVHC